jgi:TonB family protein
VGYRDQVLDPHRRNAWVATVVALHALLAYALASGLRVDGLVDRLEGRTVVFNLRAVGPAAEPPPYPPFPPLKAIPRSAPSSWLTDADFPPGTRAEGTTTFRLIVGTNGRVSGCSVTHSTGTRALDEAACRFLVRRARFKPATDETGARMVGSYIGRIRWEMPSG